MTISDLKVLLIEDNPGDARLVRALLAEVRGKSYDLVWADDLSAGLKLLTAGHYDVVLPDLDLQNDVVMPCGQ